MAEPQVCSTDVMAIFAPRCFGSAAMVCIASALALNNKAVATSGDYRNFYEIDGQRYSHTIDPKTGKPIDHKLVSVTVIDDSTMRADALATALLVMGPEEGLQFSVQHSIPALFIIREDDNFIELNSPTFRNYIQSQNTLN